MFQRGCSMLIFPANTTRIILNIGSRSAPELSPDDRTTIVLAFEPALNCQIRSGPRLHVINAAVASKVSLSTIFVDHTFKGSSPVFTAVDSKGMHLESLSTTVPVLPIRTVLTSVPAAVTIWLLRIRVERWDLATLVGAGPLLRRVHYISVESLPVKTYPHETSQSAFCEHLLPYLLRNGFGLMHVFRSSAARWHANNEKQFLSLESVNAQCTPDADDRLQAGRAGLLGGNAIFRKVGTTLPPPDGLSGPPMR